MAPDPKIVFHAQKQLFLAVSLAAIGGLMLQRNYISARIDKIRDTVMMSRDGDEEN